MADIQPPPSESDLAAIRHDLDRREEAELAATRLNAAAATGTMRSEAHVTSEARRSGVRTTSLGTLTYVPAWPSIVQRVIWYVDAVTAILLAVRFTLAILGANVTSFFGHFVSSVTAPLVWPFLALFNASLVAGVSRFETLTLVAIVVYALVAWGLVTLVGFTLSARRVVA